jgi:hypothetical protein
MVAVAELERLQQATGEENQRLRGQLADTEAAMTSQEQQVEKERELQWELQNDLAQWRRYALRNQQELQERSFSLKCKQAVAVGATRGLSCVSPSRGEAMSMRALEESLAKAEEGMGSGLEGSGNLASTVTSLLRERLEQEKALEELREEVRRAYEVCSDNHPGASRALETSVGYAR